MSPLVLMRWVAYHHIDIGRLQGTNSMLNEIEKQELEAIKVVLGKAIEIGWEYLSVPVVSGIKLEKSITGEFKPVQTDHSSLRGIIYAGFIPDLVTIPGNGTHSINDSVCVIYATQNPSELLEVRYTVQNANGPRDYVNNQIVFISSAKLPLSKFIEQQGIEIAYQYTEHILTAAYAAKDQIEQKKAKRIEMLNNFKAMTGLFVDLPDQADQDDQTREPENTQEAIGDALNSDPIQGQAEIVEPEEGDKESDSANLPTQQTQQTSTKGRRKGSASDQ